MVTLQAPAAIYKVNATLQSSEARLSVKNSSFRRLREKSRERFEQLAHVFDDNWNLPLGNERLFPLFDLKVAIDATSISQLKARHQI